MCPHSGQMSSSLASQVASKLGYLRPWGPKPTETSLEEPSCGFEPPSPTLPGLSPQQLFSSTLLRASSGPRELSRVAPQMQQPGGLVYQRGEPGAFGSALAFNYKVHSVACSFLLLCRPG